MSVVLKVFGTIWLCLTALVAILSWRQIEFDGESDWTFKMAVVTSYFVTVIVVCLTTCISFWK